MYLQKRTYSCYFRLPIPKRLHKAYGKSEICFSLNTLNRTEARLKSLEHIQHYLLEFEQRKTLPVPLMQPGAVLQRSTQIASIITRGLPF